MPTIQQLPQAVAVNPTDELMLDQSGTSVSATVAQVLAANVSTVTLTGDVTGGGSGTIVTTLAPVTTPGTYSKVSVNAKGLVVGGGSMAAADVVGALGYTPYSAANPAGYVTAATLAPVASSGRYSDLSGAPALGSLATQPANAVAITGGSVSGTDLSASTILANGASTARSLAARAAESVDVLDFGADPTGVADSAPAFAAAMAAVPSGSWGRVTVPRGTYKLNSFLNQPSGRSIAFDFQDGAVTTGPGGLGVDRVESKQGPFSQWTGGGGWFGFAPSVGSAQNNAFRTDIIQNTPANSGASRVAWSRNYANYNYYGKYVSGIDIAEQNIFNWPHLYDNSSGWGHWEVIFGSTFDEDSAARAHINASAEHSEFDIVNNGPEAGWTWKSGFGNAVQGMSIDPWGQNGQYGGGLLFSYGSVGSFDGTTGGLNWRWPSYPAVFSNGNPASVPTSSTVVITFDVTAKASASVSGGGVSGVSVSAGGGVYTSAPSVVFTGGGGSGAAGTAVMLGGSVVGVTITNAGSNYSSAPAVSFAGGGVAQPVATTVTLNPDGAHGDLQSIATAINAAAIPLVRASVAKWGGVVSRLVIFGIAGSDLGTLTLGGSALATLGINAQAYSTPRDTTVVVIGNNGSALPTDKLTLNGTVITIGGAGGMSDVVAAINNANLVGVRADVNANGLLILTCWIPQNPGGLVVSQPSGYTTLGKLGLTAGTFWPPVPPKGFASAAGELASPVCQLTDQISIAATDLAGNSYGPVTATLNGGSGTGWVADVATSIRTALTTAGFYSANSTTLTAAPAVVTVQAKGSGGNQGLLIRNTAGGTLALANVTGTPLQTLGIAPGTYQPGGYSAGSQSVFLAAEDSIAPQGRGIFLGGASNATDRTVWPNTPLEARGNFLHGLRTDKATFDDNIAVQLGAGQAIGFGSGSGAVALTASGGALQANGASLAMAAALPTRVSQLTNDAGYLATLPVASTTTLGGVKGDGSTVTISPTGVITSLSSGVGSVNGRSGAVVLNSTDVTNALGYTPVSNAGGTISGTVTLSGTGLATTQTAGDNSTKLATTGFVYQAITGAASVAVTGGTTTLTAAQYGVPVILVTGALTSNAVLVVPNNGVWTFANRTSGAFTLTVKTAGGSGVAIDQGTSVDLLADGVNVVLSTSDFNGITLQGTVTNAGTLSGGTLAGSITNTGTITGGTLGGTVTLSGTALAVTQAAGDNSTKLATTGFVYQAMTGSASVAVTGGTTTLTASQYGVPVILVTGALTSNAVLVMPNNGVWTVANRTSGTFTLTVKTAAGSGVAIDQATSVDLMADGVNVVLSTSDFNGITLQGNVTNAGTITGGTLGGTVTLSGTGLAATQAAGDNSTRLATTGYVYQATSGVAGVATSGGTTTLTAAQYGVPVILVTGALTSNAVLVVPNSGVWTVANRTTGAFTLTVKTAAGSGIAIDQAASAELIADGTNVVLATSDFSGITLQGTVTNAGTLSGGTLGGTITNAGTISGGTLAGSITNAGTINGGTLGGTVTFSGTGQAATQLPGDNSVRLATTAYVYQALTGVTTVATTGGSTTLSPAQYGTPVLLATGTLTSNATLVVPSTGVWTVANRTTGAFTLTVKTAAGTGVAVDQGNSVELFADGSNVVLATSDFNAITLQGTVTNAGTISGGALAPASLSIGGVGSLATLSAATDVGGYHPIMVANSGTNTNVPLVLAPAGAGYIASALSDGTAANGNQRGQYSVDLQQSRSASGQVASGAYATIAGGSGNTAAGQYSFVAGSGCSASGTFGVALGQGSNDGGAYGKLVFSSSSGASGSQFGLTTLYVTSASAAARMTANGGGAAGATNSLPIRTNHVIGGTLSVTARNVSNGDGATWTIPVLYKNSAGTVTVSNPGTAAIAPSAADASLSSASITIAADNTNKSLSVTITPPASVTINATASFLATEM